MASKYQAKMELWSGEEAIHASLAIPTPINSEENTRALQASLDMNNSIRLRIAWGVYIPGNPNRYWWMLGERATLVCRDLASATWAMDELKRLIGEMDGVELVTSEGL